MANSKTEQRQRRKFRIRKRIFGTTERPRLSVYRSLRYIYAQIIDDQNGRTLVAANSLDQQKGGGTKKAAEAVGAMIAERALSKNINEVSFDRNGFLYHGAIHSLAEAARKGGLKF